MPPRGEDLSPDDPAPSCVLPAGLRVRAHRTVWFAAAALAPLAGLVRGRDVPPAWDAVPPWEHVQGSPLLQTVLDVFARALPRAAPLVVLAIAAACWLSGARRAAAFALLAPACACATTVVLKHLLARPSADGTGWMFPSGHVTAVAAVAAVLTVLLLPGGVLGARISRAALAAGRTSAVLAAGATSVATVLEQHHYPTDVVGAILTSLITVLLVAVVIDRLPHRLSRPRPGSGTTTRSASVPDAAA